MRGCKTAALRADIPRRTTTGARDPNFRFERSGDWLIHDAVELFIHEHEQERALLELEAQYGYELLMLARFFSTKSLCFSSTRP